MNWRSWYFGLLWSILAGVGGGLTFVIADPQHFNVEHDWRHLLSVCAAFGLLAAGSYLKDSRPKDF